MTGTRSGQDLVTLGRINGVHGVQGWLKVYSYTEPRDNVIRYRHWTLLKGGARIAAEVEQGRLHGSAVIAKLAGTDDREAAREWVGADIAVERAALPELEPGEYYWSDLEGLAVVSTSGEPLGNVDYLIETGAHDVLVLDGGAGKLIPFALDDVVREVDLEAGRIVVDWSSDYWD